VLGGGIAGVSVAEKLREAGVDSDIALVNSEPHHLYNRMGISRVIYGRSAMSGLYLLPDNWFGDQRIDSWLNTLVSSVDVAEHTVRVATGETLEWDHLVFATGARAVVPDIAEIGLPGSFALREAGDAAQIRAHAQRVGAHRAVIGGGGLLGLEGAYSLHRLGLRATVLERGGRLLSRGIDAAASELLRGYLDRTGIDVRTTVSATALTGDGRVEAVVLSDGTTLPCDVFLYAVGVQPNAELAAAAGITVQRGIVVDDRMRTSVPDVYACGDVAEFGGRVWGLWPTAVRQAEIVAAGLLGDDERFDLIDPPTILKGVGVTLISAGRVDERPDDEVLVHEDSTAGTYARLLIADGRMVGGVLFGHAREVPHLQRLVAETADLGAVLPDLRRGDIGALARVGQPALQTTTPARG
jgi:nitrite reductase (NADH) large subunit